jgi:RNA 3'-terminal phosphate cyclase (ATP)
VTVWARDVHGNRWGGDALGRQGLRAEEVGRRAASQVLADATSGATVDRHLADHLAPWVALGMGAVRVPAVTAHLRTNLWACEAFLGADCVHLEGSVLRRYA